MSLNAAVVGTGGEIFFFQAEDGIRDYKVTGVQTCALPILRESHARFQIGPNARRAWLRHMEATLDAAPLDDATRNALRHFFSRSSAYVIRSEERRVGKERRSRWSPYP